MIDTRINLIKGEKYRVINPFTDYDNFVHEIGETWTFIGTNFVPYHDGLTLHVIKEGFSTETIYRFLWDAGGQGEIIDNFNEYVEVI